MMLNVVDWLIEMETELKDLEAEYMKYVSWCKGQGLYPEFGVEFFDWMNGAGNVTV